MAEHIGFRFSRIPRMWRAVIDQRLEPLGLTQTRWVTLFHLNRMGGGVNQCDLARRIGVEAPSLVRTLDQLAEQNLIERRPCPEDRRAKRLHLTPEAKPLIDQIDTIVRAVHTEMLTGINDDELEVLQDLLSRIEENGARMQEEAASKS